MWVGILTETSPRPFTLHNYLLMCISALMSYSSAISRALLTHKSLPSLSYIVQVCDIIAGQRYMRALNAFQRTKMLDFTTQMPQDKERILRCVCMRVLLSKVWAINYTPDTVAIGKVAVGRADAVGESTACFTLEELMCEDFVINCTVYGKDHWCPTRVVTRAVLCIACTEKRCLPDKERILRCVCVYVCV